MWASITRGNGLVPQSMDETECRARVALARVARLATTRPDGRVDLVPIVFGFVDADVVFAVDHKPKRSSNLQRLANIEANPEVTVLFDHYVDDDWDALWWVRMRGQAVVVTDSATALDALQARYQQHEAQRPEGPVVVITPTAWTGWAPQRPK